MEEINQVTKIQKIKLSCQNYHKNNYDGIKYK